MNNLGDRIRAHLDELVDQMQIPAGEMVRPLSPERAHPVSRRLPRVALGVAAALVLAGGLAIPVREALRTDTVKVDVWVSEPAPGRSSLTPLALPADADRIDQVVSATDSVVSLGRAVDGSPGLWRLDRDGTWAREPVGARLTDMFAGYAEGDEWRIVWGDDTGPGPTSGVRRAMAWVSHLGGPWAPAGLPDADGPDTGPVHGFIGPDGPVLAGYAEGGTSDSSEAHRSVVSKIQQALRNRGIADSNGISFGRRSDGQYWITATSSQQVVFEGPASDLQLDPRDIATDETFPPLMLWTMRSGGWTSQTVGPTTFGEDAVSGGLLNADGAIAVRTTNPDGEVNHWFTTDGTQWQRMSLAGDHPTLGGITAGPHGLFAYGSSGGRPAMWRGEPSDDWTLMTLPELPTLASLVAVAAGEGGPVMLATVTRTVLKPITRGGEPNTLQTRELRSAQLITAFGTEADAQHLPVPTELSEAASASVDGGERFVYTVTGPSGTALWQLESSK